jgi:hypothetical protein
MHNLETFFAIQLCSGHDCLIFKSAEAAVQAGKAWDLEQERRFEQGCSDITQSELDWDGNQVCKINPVFLSGGVTEFLPKTAPFELWETHPQVSEIKWGNTATVRPEVDNHQRIQRLDAIAARQAGREVSKAGPIVSYGTSAPPEKEVGIAGRPTPTLCRGIPID